MTKSGSTYRIVFFPVSHHEPTYCKHSLLHNHLEADHYEESNEELLGWLQEYDVVRDCRNGLQEHGLI